MQNLSELTRRLIVGDVEFVLIGGFAAVAYGVTLVTRDVDICCRFTEANLMRIQQAFFDLHPVHRLRAAALRNLYLKTDLGVVDCVSEVAGIGDFETVLGQSVTIELPFGACRILDLDALIRAKQTMNRDHDRIAVKQLNQIKKSKS